MATIILRAIRVLQAVTKTADFVLFSVSDRSFVLIRWVVIVFLMVG